MNCSKCGRYIKQASATVTTDAGQGVYGPVCSQKLGLITATIRKARTVARRARRNDRQMELLGVAV